MILRRRRLRRERPVRAEPAGLPQPPLAAVPARIHGPRRPVLRLLPWMPAVRLTQPVPVPHRRADQDLVPLPLAVPLPSGKRQGPADPRPPHLAAPRAAPPAAAPSVPG